MNDAAATSGNVGVPRWRYWLRALLGVTLSAGAIWLVFRAAGGIADVQDALAQMNPWWLIPAVVFEALSYVLSGVRLRWLAGRDVDLTVVSATELELVVNGLGLLTPASPAEGLAYATSELSRRGLTRRRIALTLGFASWFSFRIFYMASAVNLLFMLATRHLPVGATWPLVIALLVLAVLVAAAVLASRPSTAEHVAVILGALRFWKPRRSRAELRVSGARFHNDALAVVGPPRRRFQLACISFASMMSDVACLWFILIAAGARVDPDIAFLAVGAGAVAGAVPLLPGGIGVVEAVMPAVIHGFGPPISVALAGVLVYRAVGTFLPAIAGAASLIPLRAHKRNVARSLESG
ncbi:MAG: YbhN family protein [Acidimicrobiia bacterium]